MGGCFHTPNVVKPDPCLPCTPDHAAWQGKSDARANQRPDYAESGQCPKIGIDTCNLAFDDSAYRKHYREGYQTIQKERCTQNAARKRGFDDREAQADSKADLSICTTPSYRPADLERAYRTGAKEYLCNEQNLSARSRKRATSYDSLDDNSIGSQLQDLCKSHTQLLQGYRNEYSKAIRRSCRSTEAQRLGYKDGLENSDQMSRFSVCPNSMLNDTEAAYLKGYQEGRAQVVEQNRLALERQKHQDQMRIEEEKRNQAYQLELMRQANDNANREADRAMQRRLLEVARAPKNSRVNHHDKHKGPRRVVFKGRDLMVQCKIEPGHGSSGRNGTLKIFNESHHTASGSSIWDITFYDQEGMPNDATESWISIYVHPKASSTENFSSIPAGASSCTAKPR